MGYDAGHAIFAAGYPLVTQIDCSSASPIGVTVPATAKSLGYDARSKRYTLVWKTSSAFAGSCQRLIVRFTNSGDHVADFRFKNKHALLRVDRNLHGSPHFG